jgi:hypothetical protein
MSETLRLKEKYEEYLRGIKGVTGVGLNGSIIVYVEKATPEIRQVIPKQLEGVPVRVIESKFKLMALRIMDAIYADRTGRFRPAPGGVSIGHPKITAGTLTCRALDKRSLEIIGGLSNNHVIALDWGEVHEGKLGDSTLQPGPYDGGIDPTDKIGELLKYIPVKLDEDNLVDAAVFDSDELKREVLEVGNPSHTIEPKVGMKVLKSGRTSGVTYGTILDVNATLMIDGGEGWGSCLFKNQIVISPAILSPGDSGSWIGEVDTFNTVGLGFAGSDTLSVANPALTVEELLGVEIIPPTSPVRLSYMGLGLAGIFGVGILGMRGGKA